MHRAAYHARCIVNFMSHLSLPWQCAVFFWLGSECFAAAAVTVDGGKTPKMDAIKRAACFIRCLEFSMGSLHKRS